MGASVSLNLHSAVRRAVQAVNPDIEAAYLASTGYTSAADSRQLPTYAPPKLVRIQVQPPSGRDLQHINMLNLQGIIRTVYGWGFPQGVNRVKNRGGDLLFFPQDPQQCCNSSWDSWLVTWPSETWAPNARGWTRLIATLQTDGRVILDGNNMPVLNDDGTLSVPS